MTAVRGSSRCGAAMCDTLNQAFSLDARAVEEVCAEMDTRYFASASDSSLTDPPTLLSVAGQLVIPTLNVTALGVAQSRGGLLLDHVCGIITDALVTHRVPAAVAAEHAKKIASLLGSKAFWEADRLLRPNDSHKVQQCAIDIRFDGSDVYLRKTTTFVSTERALFKEAAVSSPEETQAATFDDALAAPAETERSEWEIKFTSRCHSAKGADNWRLEAKVTDVAVTLSAALTPEVVRERKAQLGLSSEPSGWVARWLAWLVAWFCAKRIHYVVTSAAELEAAPAVGAAGAPTHPRSGSFSFTERWAAHSCAPNPYNAVTPYQRVDAPGAAGSNATRLTTSGAAAQARALPKPAPMCPEKPAKSLTEQRFDKQIGLAVAQRREQRDKASARQAATAKLDEVRDSGRAWGAHNYGVLTHEGEWCYLQEGAAPPRLALGTAYVNTASQPGADRRIIDAQTRLGARLFDQCGRNLPFITLDAQPLIPGVVDGHGTPLAAEALVALVTTKDAFPPNPDVGLTREQAEVRALRDYAIVTRVLEQKRASAQATAEIPLRKTLARCAITLGLAESASLGLQRAEVEKRLLDVMARRLAAAFSNEGVRAQVLSVLLHGQDAMDLIVQGAEGLQLSNRHAEACTIAIATQRYDRTLRNGEARLAFDVSHDHLGDGAHAWLGDQNITQAVGGVTATATSRWTVSAKQAELSWMTYKGSLTLAKTPLVPANTGGSGADVAKTLAVDRQSGAKYAQQMHAQLMRDGRVWWADEASGGFLLDLGVKHLRDARGALERSCADQEKPLKRRDALAKHLDALSPQLFARCGTTTPLLILDGTDILAPHRALRLYASALRHLASPAQPGPRQSHWQGVVDRLAPELDLLPQSSLTDHIKEVEARLLDVVIDTIEQTFPDDATRLQVVTALGSLEAATYAVVYGRGGPKIVTSDVAQQHTLMISTRWTDASVPPGTALITFAQRHATLDAGATVSFGYKPVAADAMNSGDTSVKAALASAQISAWSQAQVTQDTFTLHYVRSRGAIELQEARPGWTPPARRRGGR